MLLVLMILVLIRTGQSDVFHNLTSVNAVEYDQGGDEDRGWDDLVVDLDVCHEFENLDDEAQRNKEEQNEGVVVDLDDNVDCFFNVIDFETNC